MFPYASVVVPPVGAWWTSVTVANGAPARTLSAIAVAPPQLDRPDAARHRGREPLRHIAQRLVESPLSLHESPDSRKAIGVLDLRAGRRPEPLESAHVGLQDVRDDPPRAIVGRAQ